MDVLDDPACFRATAKCYKKHCKGKDSYLIHADVCGFHRVSGKENIPPTKILFVDVFSHIFQHGVLGFGSVSCPPPPSPARPVPHTRLCHTHHTTLLHTALSHTTLSHTICHTHAALSHTQLCHTQLCHTHTHTTLSQHCRTHNFVTHTICHTPTQPCHTHNFVTRNFVTHHLSHTTLSHTHTPSFTYNFVRHTALFYFSVLHHLLCLSFLPRPRYNIWCSLLEEIALWGYPVL